ncbi:helix-turn-helix transcriptional regulator [Cupriavidus necator]|uniref:hypothetical protein n=1 Tax=Cupriavidus necator TaxID=106590 RepID=UPI0039C446E1
MEELAAARTLSLGLALPDRRLQALCHALREDPDSTLTLSERAHRCQPTHAGAPVRERAEDELRPLASATAASARVDLMCRGKPLAHAAETGYAHAGAFSTMFRRTLGQTPRDFMARRRAATGD